MKALVVYYSWTGNTERVAQEIARRLGCDIEAIRETKPRKGRFARLRCALDTAFKRRPRIEPLSRSPADYDCLIIGTPVWARSIAGPMRTFLDTLRGCPVRTGVFCTEAGTGGELVLDLIASGLPTPPAARLVVSSAQFASGAWLDETAAFIAAIAPAPAEQSKPVSGVA